MELGNAEFVTAIGGFGHGGMPRGDNRDGGEDLLNLPFLGPVHELLLIEQTELPFSGHFFPYGFGR